MLTDVTIASHNDQDIIKKKRWGLSATLEDDDDGKWDKVTDYLRRCVSQKKSDIKKAVRRQTPLRFSIRLHVIRQDWGIIHSVRCASHRRRPSRAANGTSQASTEHRTACGAAVEDRDEESILRDRSPCNPTTLHTHRLLGKAFDKVLILSTLIHITSALGALPVWPKRWILGGCRQGAYQGAQEGQL